jgi:hypothetical protein
MDGFTFLYILYNYVSVQFIIHSLTLCDLEFVMNEMNINKFTRETLPLLLFRGALWKASLLRAMHPNEK